jgi:flagellum-specific ATP synthase
MAARKAAQDLIDVGAYQRGTNPLVDAAMQHEAAINAFLQQGMAEKTPASEAWNGLKQLVDTLGGS